MDVYPLVWRDKVLELEMKGRTFYFCIYQFTHARSHYINIYRRKEI